MGMKGADHPVVATKRL